MIVIERGIKHANAHLQAADNMPRGAVCELMAAAQIQRRQPLQRHQTLHAHVGYPLYVSSRAVRRRNTCATTDITAPETPGSACEVDLA